MMEDTWYHLVAPAFVFADGPWRACSAPCLGNRFSRGRHALLLQESSKVATMKSGLGLCWQR